MQAAHTTRSLALGACVLVAALSGCTILRLQREEAQDVDRVHQKEATLQAEQDRSASLDSQKERLTTDLSEHQLSLAELNERIERINTENGREIAANDAARAERQQRLQELQETSAQLAAANQNHDDSSEQKRARVDYLKSQIKQQLDLLLH